MPVKPLFEIGQYFDLILLILLGLGLVFELPVLIFFLSLFGIVTPKFLIKNFRYALLVITILAAVLTPTPDALTMILFMSVLVALYFIGVAVSWVVVRKRNQRQAAAALKICSAVDSTDLRHAIDRAAAGLRSDS